MAEMGTACGELLWQKAAGRLPALKLIFPSVSAPRKWRLSMKAATAA